MTTPETQGGELDKHIQHERFLMIHGWEDHGLTLAERAVLIEGYKEPEWRNETALAYYEGLFEDIEAHPGEFISAITTYGHCIGVEILLPDPEGDILEEGYIGGVGLRRPDNIDISNRIPFWSHFPSGIEFYFPFNEDSYSVPTYSTPFINLTDARLIQGRGTNKPEDIKVVVGNKALVDNIQSLIADERITRVAARDFALALAVLSEGHQKAPVPFPDLLDDVSESERFYLNLHELFLHQQKTNADLIRKINVARAAFELGRGQLHQQHMEIPTAGESTSLRTKDTRSWPHMTLGDFSGQVNSLDSVVTSLENDNKELVRNQIPLTTFYLSAIRHLIVESLKIQNS